MPVVRSSAIFFEIREQNRGKPAEMWREFEWQRRMSGARRMGRNPACIGGKLEIEKAD